MTAAPITPGDASSEELFLAFVRGRDARMLEQLLREHLPRAYAMARRMLGREADAEDAVQEALAQLVRTADRYDGSVPFGAWLGQLVHRAALQLWRTRTRRAQRERPAAAAPDAGRIQPEVPEGDDLAAAIRAAVAELPEQFRAPIELHYFGALSQQETAEALGLKEDAVAQRLHRGRERLREALRRRGMDLGIAALLASLEAPGPRPDAAWLARVLRHAAAPARGARHVAAIGAGAVAVACLTGGGWWLRSQRPPLPPPASAPTLASASTPTRPSDERLAASGGGFSQRWDFEQDHPPGLQVITGSWHHVADGGVDGSGCMETDSDLFAVAVALPVPRRPLRMDVQSCARLPAPAAGHAVILAYEAPTRVVFLRNVGIQHHQDPPPDGSDNTVFYPERQFIGTDSYDRWVPEGRSALEFYEAPGEQRLVLFVRGHHRLDQLRLTEIAPGELPDISAERQALAAIPPERRHGQVELSGMTGGDPAKPVVADFWAAAAPEGR